MPSRKQALIALLAALHTAVVFAGFFAPYHPAAQDRLHPYAPPTRLHLIDASGFHLFPRIHPLISLNAEQYAEDLTASYPVRLLVRGHSYSVLGIFKSNLHLFGVDRPGRITLLGTDAYGRDQLSRLLYGGQLSLAAGLVGTAISLAIAILVGTISGYYASFVDEFLMGGAELLLALPWLYLLFAARAFLPLHLGASETFFLLTCVIGLIGWARPARLVRGIVLSAKTSNFVLAAHGFGASDVYLLRRHILPETFSLLATQAALLVPQFIAAEASLSFFGLGVSEPQPSWGNMLTALQQYHVLVSCWWMLAPAFALLVTSVSYCLLADTLQSDSQ